MTIDLLTFIPINRLTLMACFAASSGVYFFIHGLQLFAMKRSLGRTNESLIRDASPGPVAVSGLATGPHTLTSPINGERCYLYQSTVWQRSESGRKDWEKVAEETLHLPFFVQDSTGQLLVEPLGAEIDLQPEFHEEYGGSFAPPSEVPIPPRVSAYLSRHGIELERAIRVEERCIRPETPLFVAGTVTENPGIRLRPFSPRNEDSRNSNSYRGTFGSSAEPTQRPEIIRLSSGSLPSSTQEMTQQGKIAAALTRAGITKPEAWAAAGVPFQSVVVEENPQTEEFSPERSGTSEENELGPTSERAKNETVQGFVVSPPLVLMKGADGAAFVVSSRGQSDLVSSLGWKAVAFSCVGPLLTTLGAYVLLLEWHLR